MVTLTAATNIELMKELERRRKEAIALAIKTINNQLENLRDLDINIQSNFVEGFVLEKIISDEVDGNTLIFTEKYSKKA